MKKMISIFICCILMSGCAIHYRNEKGIKAKGKDFQTKIGNIEKGSVHFWSEFEVWLPWKPKDNDGKVQQ